MAFRLEGLVLRLEGLVLCHLVEGVGFRDWGLGFRFLGTWFRLEGLVLCHLVDPRGDSRLQEKALCGKTYTHTHRKKCGGVTPIGVC